MVFNQANFPEMDKFFRRNLINCLSGFKSVNLVGTINKNSETNLAIFSQIFHLGATPALMGMIVRPDIVPRHTLQNILETEYYTFNHIQESFFEQAHQTSARYEVSEFEATGLKETYSDKHPAPYVADASIKMGLKLLEKQKLQVNNTIFVIGEVVEIIVADEYLSEDGFIDLEKAGTITSTGLDSYHKTQKIARLSYAKTHKKPDRL